MTPRLFAEMAKHERARQRELHTLTALLRMDVINFSMGRPKTPVKLEDLLPAQKEARGPEKPKRRTAKRRALVADRIREAMAAFPGGLIVKG